MKKIFSIISAVFIFVLLIAIGTSSCDSSSYKQKEIDAWNDQMSRHPNTWTKEERNRYNNFMEWADKQDGD